MTIRLQPAHEPDVVVALFDLLGERDDERLHQVADAVSPLRQRCLQQDEPAGVDLGGAALEDGDHQPALVAEVVLRDAVVALTRGEADLAHRDTVDAALGEHPLGGVDQQLPRLHVTERSGVDTD